MAANKTYRVMPADDGWIVKAEGAKRASSRHTKKPEAVKQARVFAERPGTVNVIIHRQDGTVQESRTYN